MWYVTYVYANHRPPQRLVQQAPATQLTCAQAPAGELIGHRSPARSRTAFATRPSRSSCCPLTASAPACLIPSVKQTQSTRCGYRGYAFFEYRPYPQVSTHVHEVHGWELKSGRAVGIGDNSSWYGGSSTHQRDSSSCVLLAFRPKEDGASTRRARHSTLCLSSSTWSRSTRGPRHAKRTQFWSSFACLRACGPASRHTQARRAARQVSFVISSRGETRLLYYILIFTFTQRVKMR